MIGYIILRNHWYIYFFRSSSDLKDSLAIHFYDIRLWWWICCSIDKIKFCGPKGPTHIEFFFFNLVDFEFIFYYTITFCFILLYYVYNIFNENNVFSLILLVWTNSFGITTIINSDIYYVCTLRKRGECRSSRPENDRSFHGWRYWSWHWRGGLK